MAPIHPGIAHQPSVAHQRTPSMPPGLKVVEY